MRDVEKEKLNKGHSDGLSSSDRYNLSNYGTTGR